MLCKNSQRLNTVNYFCRKIHLRCFLGFWIRLRLSSHLIYIKLDDRIYSYTIICSYTVNVNLTLICIELSELIIYCKYAWKFAVFEVMYYIFLYYTFLPIHSSLTHKSHMRVTPSLKLLVSAINLQPYQITLWDSIRDVLRTQSSFYNEVLLQK